jgi:hypothetical protein
MWERVHEIVTERICELLEPDRWHPLAERQ